MEDKLITCPRCSGTANYMVKTESHTQQLCFGCGFTTNSFWNEKNESFKDLEKTIPELYKELKWIDPEGNFWYPNTINNKTKGMIFADGTSKTTWKWTAVKAVPIDKKEKYKFPPSQTHKIDMNTAKHFEEKDYIEALDYIDYFKK